MSPPAAVDPHWSVADLLEHARRLAAAARDAGPPPADVRTHASQVQDRCSGLEVLLADAARCGRRRDGRRLAQALDRFVCAADDLAAITLLRCDGSAATTETPDLAALLGRVGERHDLVVTLLQQSGIRRTYPSR